MEDSPSATTLAGFPPYLADFFANSRDVFWASKNELFVADPKIARRILLDEGELYAEDQDFFTKRPGAPVPRDCSIAIGRRARTFLGETVTRREERLPELLSEVVRSELGWPDAANRLMYLFWGDLLLGPDALPSCRDLIPRIMERAVLAGAAQRRSWLDRLLFKRKVHAVFRTELARRKTAPVPEPRDLLDVVIAGSGGLLSDAQILDVLVSFIFALTGSTSFVIAWAIYLLGGNLADDIEPAWVITETLRLWPVAWMLPRRPKRSHELGGQVVDSKHLVVVSPFLVNRHPDYWTDPENFEPRRWAGNPSRVAWIPFGYGPHMCIAASLVPRLAEQVLRHLDGAFDFAVEPLSRQPILGPALAPPPFALRAEARP